MTGALLVFALAALGALLALNVTASRTVLACDLDTHGRKLAQLAVVWLIPVIGAVVVLIVIRGRADAGRRGYAEPRESLDEFDVSKRDYDGND